MDDVEDRRADAVEDRDVGLRRRPPRSRAHHDHSRRGKREGRDRTAHRARGPRPGSRTKPSGCGERPRGRARLSPLPLAAAVRLDPRRRARPRNADSTEEAVEGGGLPGAITNAIGDAARSAHSDSWWLLRSACRSSSGPVSRARRRSSSFTRSSGTSPRRRPSRSWRHLPLPAGCVRSCRQSHSPGGSVRTGPGCSPPCSPFAPLALLWLWVSLHLPHGDASGRAVARCATRLRRVSGAPRSDRSFLVPSSRSRPRCMAISAPPQRSSSSCTWSRSSSSPHRS